MPEQKKKFNFFLN